MNNSRRHLNGTLEALVPSYAISINNLSKCHHIYERPEDRLKQIIIPRIQRLLGKPQSAFCRDFWALKNISLSISKGETIGVIGRNGAGKSTLLQMLCGTLAPTTGTIATTGRIAALLELGSGFNPDFTGRENVYLNAAVLGLQKHEIDARFDDIATFAGIGDFIDQPVKTYSSGMFVRLAFAVIAHVDADILIIDEALAVGDAVFTQKCMRFLRRFKEQGTLVFVSHDINSVINLCERALWLDQGGVRMLGSAKDVAEAYFQYTVREVTDSHSHAPEIPLRSPSDPIDKQVAPSSIPATHQLAEADRPTITLFKNLQESTGWNTGSATITSIRLLKKTGEESSAFKGGDEIRLEVDASVHKDITSPIIGFFVKDKLGQALFGENTYGYSIGNSASTESAVVGETLTGRFEFTLPLLPSGTYTMTVAIAEGTPTQNVQHHWIHDAVVFNVVTARLWLGLVGIPFESVSLLKSTSSDKTKGQASSD
jgi:lipopolysaccharide transport system ATP-binding protein